LKQTRYLVDVNIFDGLRVKKNKRPRWPQIAHLVSEAPNIKALGFEVSEKKIF